MKLGLGGLRNLRSCWLSSEHATPVAVTRGWGCRCKPRPPKWLLEALRLHPNKTGHRRQPPVSSAAASSFSRFAPFLSRLPRGSCCTGLRMLLESCSLRCCLHVFCRVEFPTSRSFPMRLAARGSPGHQACGGECCYSLSRSFYFRSTYVNRAVWGPFATDTRPSSAFS